MRNCSNLNEKEKQLTVSIPAPEERQYFSDKRQLGVSWIPDPHAGSKHAVGAFTCLLGRQRGEKSHSLCQACPWIAMKVAQTWRYSQHLRTQLSTCPPFLSVYLITLLQTLRSTFKYRSSMCWSSDSRSEVGRWIMKDYQHENDSICLNCAKPYCEAWCHQMVYE